LTKYTINIKRVYDKRSGSNDFFILVDRLWPRGISRHESNFDLWMKDIAPSNSLRKRFNHDPNKWEEFKKEYHQEFDLKGQGVGVDILKKIKEMCVISLCRKR
jgi:uncharacterized protein YeaO (DUF488 family)